MNTVNIPSTSDAASPRAVEAAAPVFEFDAAGGRFKYAYDDLKAALSRPQLMYTLIKNDFAVRFQGSMLGGFWVTVTTLATVTGLGLMYSQIFGASLKVYFPYVAVGIIVWGVISSLINEGAAIFTGGAGVFNQTPMPKSLFAFKALGRAGVNFLFKLIVLVGVIVALGIRPGFGAVLTSIAGLVLIFWTGFWVALGLGTLGARFKDVGQLANTFVTFAFFMTPVFWQSGRLGAYEHLIHYNPFFHFLNIVRGPLLGNEHVAASFVWAGGAALVSTVFGAALFGVFARRLSYWC
ncbi:MAG: ABC transporter permease [Pseudomonadota bacterium]